MKSNPLITKNKPSKLKARGLLLRIISIILLVLTPGAKGQTVPPVLEFPEVGLDDTSTYRGYTTRFFRDSEGNTIQISIDDITGRILNLWADAANESMSFTVRDEIGQPAKPMWDSPEAKVFSKGNTRYIQYSLFSNTSTLNVGLFILASMRIERDFRYQKGPRLPFNSEPFTVKEFSGLISSIEQLPEKLQYQHLALLKAKNIGDLRSRLVPQVKRKSKSVVLIEQPTLDGENHLSLELSVDSREATVEVLKDHISIRSLRAQPIRLSIKVGTDSPPLTPIRREDIFNSKFFQFYERAKSEYNSLLHESGTKGKDIVKDERLLYFRRLDRQVKSMELMSSQEKLLAGLPNYATYFGRDMMMSALMLEPVWTPEMLEHVITSVLKKITPTGEVSHEEGLGGQAIRENAAKYNRLIAEYLQWERKKNNPKVTAALTEAEDLLSNIQKVTENYRMIDDDFQLPVLVALYLTRSDITNRHKHDFLQSAMDKESGTSKLALLMRNLAYVSQVTEAYVENPVVGNLISFPRIDEQRWSPGSWRDSGVGYANGRFAMDINVVWVPQALESIEKILMTLREIGIPIDDLQTFPADIHRTRLIRYAQKPETLQKAIKIWENTARHFEVHLSPQEVKQQVQAKLDWLPTDERTYWDKVIVKSEADEGSLNFWALSLDGKGKPIPVVNTDIATWLFLEDLTTGILNGEADQEEIIRRLRIFVTPYPVGLFLESVGPVVANDAYASPTVWADFDRDLYHSPRVIWGREVNLLLLGLAKQILTAYDFSGQLKDPSLAPYVRELQAIRDSILTAVESSGLKHNELWSYRIVDNKLVAARYSSTTDIQLWNLTDLAVQFSLERISGY